MIRKISGAVLMVIGVFVGIVLLTYGGPVFPHIFGPSAAVLIGVLLVTFKRKPR
jgi:hypothetical protein